MNPTGAVLSAAQKFLGKRFIPVPVRGKAPVLQGWQNLDHASVSQSVDELFADDSLGVGLLLGKPSGGLVDVDKERSEVVADVSEATVHRRLKKPEFRRRVHELRAEMLSGVVGQLSELGSFATSALRDLLQAEDHRTRLGTARTILDNLFRGMEIVQMSEEIETLRAEVEALKDHADRNLATTGEALAGADGDHSPANEQSPPRSSTG